MGSPLEAYPSPPEPGKIAVHSWSPSNILNRVYYPAFSILKQPRTQVISQKCHSKFFHNERNPCETLTPEQHRCSRSTLLMLWPARSLINFEHNHGPYSLHTVPELCWTNQTLHLAGGSHQDKSMQPVHTLTVLPVRVGIKNWSHSTQTWPVLYLPNATSNRDMVFTSLNRKIFYIFRSCQR